jgi:hypothetical protein
VVGTVTKAPIALYYDSGELDRLSDYQRVVLQPDQVAERLLEFDIDLYALSYADGDGLAEFATRRAGQFGLHSFISDRALSRI